MSDLLPHGRRPENGLFLLDSVDSERMNQPPSIHSDFKRGPVTGTSWRAISLGLICAAGECLIASYNDYVIRIVFLAGGHFPMGPFFVLTILC